MAKKNDSNFKKAMNEFLGSSVKEESVKAEREKTLIVEEPAAEAVTKTRPVEKKAANFSTIKPLEEAVIPAGMVITGNVTTQSNMRIEGSIVGDVIAEGNILLVGMIEGNVSADNIVIQGGTMKGDLTVKGDATIENSSSLKGNLTATNVYLNAETQGQINASGTVELRNQAFVHGDITAATFSVTSGAKIKGVVAVNE